MQNCLCADVEHYEAKNVYTYGVKIAFIDLY